MKTPESVAALALGSVICFAPLAANATQFDVTGTVNFGNGDESLPAGITFGDSTYDGNSGFLTSGQFVFPQVTASGSTDLGPIEVTYQLTQNNTSVGLVDDSGYAVMTAANMTLHIVSVTLNGSDLSIGSNCNFEPVMWDALGGTATASGIDLTQATFEVPQADSGHCGTYTSLINDTLTGNDNSLALHIVGDFTPPAVSDLIFLDGFQAH